MGRVCGCVADIIVLCAPRFLGERAIIIPIIAADSHRFFHVRGGREA